MSPPDVLRRVAKPLTDGQVEDLVTVRYGACREYGDCNVPADEQAFLIARDAVSDADLVTRMNATPDIDGATLVEPSEFLAKRMRYICKCSDQPKPVKWKYCDLSRRITPDSIVTVH